MDGMTEAEIQTARDAAGTDLKWLLERESISQNVQDRLFCGGVTEPGVFAMMATTEAELKTILKDAFGLQIAEGAAGLQQRMQISRVTVAWTKARTRMQRQSDHAADAEVLNKPKQIPLNEYAAMRRGFEGQFRELEDRQAPSVQYLEALSDRIEKGLLRPEALSEVTDYTQGETTEVVSQFDAATGVFKTSRPLAKREMPKDMEELRERLRLMSTAWLTLALHMPGNPTMKGLSREDFNDHVDYLAGERVLRYGLRTESVQKPLPPNWPLLLSYEKELRREALRLCQKGHTLSTALKAAREDNAHRNRYFLEQLFGGASTAGRAKAPPAVPKAGQVAPAKRAAEAGEQPPAKKTQAQKRNERRRAANQAAIANAAGANAAPGPAAAPDAGKGPCWDFNKQTGCTRGNKCRFQHVCTKCGKRGHGATSCRS